ncbi:MAG: hypothetical protein R6X02_26625 [Enhygromyxa sp.]
MAELLSRNPPARAFLGGALALAVALIGCKAGEGEQAKTEAAPAPAQAPLPATEAELLAELMPLPGGAEAIEIRYAVTGPALEGELTILLRQGGYKRERWELRTSGGATQLRSAGLAVVNPEQIWSAPEGEPGELRTNLLGGLARAWLALDQAERAAVAEALRDWHELLARRRAEVPGDQGEVLGVACLRTRIAAQNLCMWEEAGVFLRYEGSAFTIEATQIDRSPTIPADAFTPPPESRDATRLEAEAVDFDAALAEAAKGNFADLVLLVSRTRALPKMAEPKPEPR